LAISVVDLLLFLLMIGGAGTLLPAADEPQSPPALSELEPEDTDEDGKGILVAPSVGTPRALNTKGRLSRISAGFTVLQMSADLVPHSHRLISTLPAGALAERCGAGISLRC
jgi:hypothetical protein